MNSSQLKIKLLLTKLVEGQDYQISPSTQNQIDIFTKRAIDNGVEAKVVQQLIELYEISDFFHYDIVLGFHHCDDLTIFEWWDDKELWLGQRDFNTLRWTNNKFCLGDAGSSSFSIDYEFDTLVELIEGCIKEIDEANNYDLNKMTKNLLPFENTLNES